MQQPNLTRCACQSHPKQMLKEADGLEWRRNLTSGQNEVVLLLLSLLSGFQPCSHLDRLTSWQYRSFPWSPVRAIWGKSGVPGSLSVNSLGIQCFTAESTLPTSESPDLPSWSQWVSRMLPEAHACVGTPASVGTQLPRSRCGGLSCSAPAATLRESPE